MNVDGPQQLGSTLTDGESSVQFDPVFSPKRQGRYAPWNRLTRATPRETIMRTHSISVPMPTTDRRSFPLGPFIRASSLHVGAAAAAAALRRDLVDNGALSGTAFDEAYAIARVTPGTNLLAMFTLLGERFAGWTGALAALAVGTLTPAVIAVTLGAAYVTYAEYPLANQAMQGARAGALAVFLWAIVRLIRPQLQQHGRRGMLLAIATLTIAVMLPIPQFVILLISGAVGAAFLRGQP